MLLEAIFRKSLGLPKFLHLGRAKEVPDHKVMYEDEGDHGANLESPVCLPKANTCEEPQ